MKKQQYKLVLKTGNETILALQVGDEYRGRVVTRRKDGEDYVQFILEDPERVRLIPTLTEWNLDWEYVENENTFNSTKVNGEYRIEFISAHTGVTRHRLVYFNDELIEKCYGMCSGYSYAQRVAYNHKFDTKV